MIKFFIINFITYNACQFTKTIKQREKLKYERFKGTV